jgi:roadblock/LC7 domain-containing protein
VPKDIGLKYALVSALVSHCEIPQQYDRLLQYSFELPKEFAVLLAQLLVSRDVTLTTTAPTFTQWKKKYQDVLLTK